MTAENQFTVVEAEGRKTIVLEVPGGILKLGLPDATPPERVEEITDYLNLVIEEVTFKKMENMEPDLERLNEEQPVSEAVVHP